MVFPFSALLMFTFVFAKTLVRASRSFAYSLSCKSQKYIVAIFIVGAFQVVFKICLNFTVNKIKSGTQPSAELICSHTHVTILNQGIFSREEEIEPWERGWRINIINKTKQKIPSNFRRRNLF